MNNVILLASARAKPAKPAKPAWTFGRLLAALWMIALRDKLAAQASGDGSDAAYTWGL